MGHLKFQFILTSRFNKPFLKTPLKWLIVLIFFKNIFQGIRTRIECLNHIKGKPLDYLHHFIN